MYQSFQPSRLVHVLNYLPSFENSNTVGQTIFWGDLQPAFKAWPAQQNFTVPLFQLCTSSLAQCIYKIGADANTPPVVSGFNADVFLLGWVYDSQVCGSVPLLSVVLSALTDHYFTTNPFYHDTLIADGWADSGVIAFVIPLNDS